MFDAVTGVRTLVVWVPDWPIVAAGVAADAAAAVFHANRVVASSAVARHHGVVRHLRRRESQSRCPRLDVIDADPDRDARRFEPVAAALDELTPRIELTRPGLCAFPTRGPSRYFGGDDALAAKAKALVDSVLPPHVAAQIGIADGPFAARHAARRCELAVVPAGESPAFLAPLPLAALDLPDLTDVLARLGLRSLGDLAALPAADVLGRFGTEGQLAHRLASGLDERPPSTDPPPDDLMMTAELDPPADVVAPAAFVAKALADELEHRLASRGSACTRIVIGAETEHGEIRERVWRHEGALSAGAIADRLRWQLDGWLNGSVRHRPTAGIVRLWLIPEEIVAANGRQLGFWGGDAAAAQRAVRALARVQGLLGTDEVFVPEFRGGRSPIEQVALVPAATVDLEGARPAARPSAVEAPWPGKIPAPSPANVFTDPPRVEVLDRAGMQVGVTGRGEPTADPASMRIGHRTPVAITGWAGPWPADERWWEPGQHRRRARFQLVTVEGTAHLVTLEDGRWYLEATYD